jgi:hypothetical protein
MNTAIEQQNDRPLCERLHAATVPGHATRQVADGRATDLAHLAS